MKELFQKLGLLNNKEKEVKKNTKSSVKDVKENKVSEKINGILFNSEEKGNTLKGCSFSKDA